MSEVKSGVETTEYAEAKSGGVWGIVTTVLGIIVTVLPNFIDKLNEESMVAIIAGAVIAVAGIVQTTLTKLGYIKSRTDVKVAASAQPNVIVGSELKEVSVDETATGE